jgi:hypothetical protein
LAQVGVVPEIKVKTRSGWQVLAMAISIAVLAVGVPGALLFTVEDVGRSQAWVITLVIAVWGGIRLSVLWVNGIPKLFDFFLWLYTYLFIGIAASVQIRTGEVASTTPGMRSVLDLPAAYAVLLGLVCYEVARLIAALIRSRRPEIEPKHSRVSAPRAVILYLFGLGFAAYFLAKLGLRVVISSRDTAFAMLANAWADPATRSIMSALAAYPLLVGTGAIVQVRRVMPKGASWRGLYAVMIGVGIMVMFAVTSPISSARYAFGTVAFSVVVYLGGTRTAARARFSMAGMIAAMIFLFPVADAFRRVKVDFGVRSSFFGEYAGNADYDSFWQIANAVAYYMSGMVVPMRQLMGSLLFWVPRVLWSNKPTDTGILLAHFRGYTFDNLSAPIWAEFMVNGGPLFVAVGFLILGGLFSSMDQRMIFGHYQGGWWGLAGAVLPVYTMILMRGSLLQATGALIVALGCLWWVRKAPLSNEPPTVQQSPPY